MGYISLEGSGFGPNSQGVAAVFTNNAASAGIPGTDPSDAPFNNRTYQWVPFDTTLKSLFIKMTAAPGSGKTVNFRYHKGQGSIISAIQQITGAVSTEVSNAVEEDMPALDTTNDTAIRGSITYITAWASTSGNAAGSGYLATEYFDAVHPGYIWLCCCIGGDVSTASFAGTDGYSALCDQQISSAFTSQQNKQIRMPIKGKLKYAWAAWRGFTSTTTVEAFLQKGAIGAGSDTAIGFSMTGAATTTPYQASIDSSTEVSVAQGDYLNWRIKRTAGAATTGSIALGVGFAPGVG